MLFAAHLESANLRDAHLEGADLRRAFLDPATYLTGTVVSSGAYGAVRVVNTRWGGVTLDTVDWSQLPVLGDELTARQGRLPDGRAKDLPRRLRDFQRAVHAYRQLATVLRGQGLHEVADRFAYRAQLLQSEVYRRQWRLGAYVGSTILNDRSGYGFKPARSLLLYLAMIIAFAATYFMLGPAAHIPLSPLEAVVFSVTSFHGRGFAPTANIALSNPLTVLAAAEAVLGLLVEITFIATITQRFFGAR